MTYEDQVAEYGVMAMRLVSQAALVEAARADLQREEAALARLYYLCSFKEVEAAHRCSSHLLSCRPGLG